MAHDRGSVDGSFRIRERMLRRADSEAKRVTGPKGRTRDNVVEYNRPRVVIPARIRVARVFLFQSKPSSVFVSSILGYGLQFLPAKIRRRIENLDRIFRPIRVRNVTFFFFFLFLIRRRTDDTNCVRNRFFRIRRVPRIVFRALGKTVRKSRNGSIDCEGGRETGGGKDSGQHAANNDRKKTHSADGGGRIRVSLTCAQETRAMP